MAKKTAVLFPTAEAILREFGENIRLARLRRNIPAKLEAERAGISVATLAKIERGVPTVALGHYMQVLMTLGLERDFLKVAADDELGRKLQDIGLSVRRRATRGNMI